MCMNVSEKNVYEMSKKTRVANINQTIFSWYISSADLKGRF